MLKTFAVLIIGCLCTMSVVGCQSMGMGEKPAMMSDSGMTAVTNHGSVVFLKGANGEVQMMSNSADPVCAQCKMDAAEYFKTGKMTDKCAVCGATHYALMRGK